MRLTASLVALALSLVVVACGAESTPSGPYTGLHRIGTNAVGLAGDDRYLVWAERGDRRGVHIFDTRTWTDVTGREVPWAVPRDGSVVAVKLPSQRHYRFKGVLAGKARNGREFAVATRYAVGVLTGKPSAEGQTLYVGPTALAP